MRAVNAPYEPDAAFRALYATFTSDPESIGAHLGGFMAERDSDGPMLVASGSDVVLFPGAGRPPHVEAFRRTTRGFIEMTSVSHLGIAVPWIVRMRELGDARWRSDALRLLDDIDAVRIVNGEAYWRSIGVVAYRGRETKIANLVGYACDVTAAFLRAGLDDERRLTFDVVRDRFLDPVDSRDVPVPMNDMMVATFALAFLDIGYRFIAWLGKQDIDWERAMVLIAGQSGRPTAGLTWATNNMCHLLWRVANERLPYERVYVAPFAPAFDAGALEDPSQATPLEAAYRSLWSRTRSSVEMGRAMYGGYPAFETRVPVPPLVDESTVRLDALPGLASLHDRRALIARLRIVMEDPGQLISNAAAHYVIDQLCASDNRPEDVFVPGFSDVAYPARTSGAFVV
jgi:hypothetical protein